mgnify:CR=1 FL=1
MKLNKLFLLAPVAVLSLTSCGKQVRYSEDKYILNYNDAANPVPYASTIGLDAQFNILQLSDIHFTYLADNEYHFKFIEKTITAAQNALKNTGGLHLIVITGDTFTFATKDTIKSCCNFFEKQKIPWTITFGNHDEQGYFSVDWMTNYLTKLSKNPTSNLLFVDYPNDDVFGSANFVIDLHEKEGEHIDDNRQIIMIDSNRYNYGEGMGYDYIHTDQIDWYERMYHYIKNTNTEGSSSTSPTSLAFFHIPLPEFTDAYNEATKNKTLFQQSNVFDGGEEPIKTNFLRDIRGEDESSPKVNSHFLDRIMSTKAATSLPPYTRGIFVGHDHINNYCVNYDYDKDETPDITFGYGIKATNTVYYDEAYLGGQIIKFNRKGVTTDLVLHKYSQMEVK